MPEPKAELKAPVAALDPLNDHQRKLAQSGYRLPDAYYIQSEQPGESTEKKSGDGGVGAAEIDQDASEVGQEARSNMITRDEFEARIEQQTAERDRQVAEADEAAKAERQAARDRRIAGGAKRGAGPGQNKQAKPPSENKSETGEVADDLGKVDFASGAAEDAAKEAGLTAADFKRKSKSSDSGFTKADVEEIAAAKKGE